MKKEFPSAVIQIHACEQGYDFHEQKYTKRGAHVMMMGMRTARGGEDEREGQGSGVGRNRMQHYVGDYLQLTNGTFRSGPLGHACLVNIAERDARRHVEHVVRREEELNRGTTITEASELTLIRDAGVSAGRRYVVGSILEP